MKDEMGCGGQGVGLQGPKGSGSDLEGPMGSKGRPTGYQGVKGQASNDSDDLEGIHACRHTYM